MEKVDVATPTASGSGWYGTVAIHVEIVTLDCARARARKPKRKG